MELLCQDEFIHSLIGVSSTQTDPFVKRDTFMDLNKEDANETKSVGSKIEPINMQKPTPDSKATPQSLIFKVGYPYFKLSSNLSKAMVT